MPKQRKEWKKKMELEEQYNYLIDYGIVSQETLDIITSINGYSEETINDVLYATTGYHDMEQYTEYEDKETYKEYYNKGSED